MARTGAHHSALWDKALTDAEKEAARLTIACGCGVMPAKGCQGGGGDWHEADEGEPLRGPVYKAPPAHSHAARDLSPSPPRVTAPAQQVLIAVLTLRLKRCHQPCQRRGSHLSPACLPCVSVRSERGHHR